MIHRKETRHIYKPIDSDPFFEVEIDADGVIYLWDCFNDDAPHQIADMTQFNMNHPNDRAKLIALAEVILHHAKNIEP